MEVDNALKIIYTMQEVTINTSSVSMASRDNFDGMEKRPWLSVDDILDELDADDLEPVMQGSDDEEFVLEGAEDFEESDPDSDAETQDVLSGEDPTLTPRDLPSPPSHTSSTTTPSPPPSDTSSTPSPPPESLVWTTELEPVDIEPFTEAVGPTFDIPASPCEVFQHFFTNEICSMITQQTNLYASQVMGAERYSTWEKVTVDELRAYFGFSILMGLVQLPAINDYWRRDLYFHYSPIADRISRDRFRDIHRYLHFTDNSTLPVRGEPGYDCLGKVRPVMTALQELFLDKYNPHREQSIDEAMIPFQGRSSLKQYLPAKPIKRGIKVWCRADPHNGYLSELQVYTGRAGSGGRQHNLGERVVLDLSRKLEGLHYHMYFDNYFTSVSLLSSLLSKGLYGCGTARQSYVGFPDALKMKGKGKREQRRLGMNNRYIHGTYVCQDV